jgi:hypothetical protein
MTDQGQVTLDDLLARPEPTPAPDTRDGPPDGYPLAGDQDGDTFRRKLDAPRLSTLLGAVLGLMVDGRWRTLAEIHRALGRGSEASISARLRDLRKPKFGGYLVHRRRRGEATAGVHEYRLERADP